MHGFTSWLRHLLAIGSRSGGITSLGLFPRLKNEVTKSASLVASSRSLN